MQRVCLVFACLPGLFAAAAFAQPLTVEQCIERMDVFGDDFLVEVLEGPVIEDPLAWVNRRAGEYRFRYVSGSDDGAVVQTERHIPDPENPANAWERHVGDRLVESFLGTEDRDVVIVEEVERKRGFRLEIEPGVHVPAMLAPGEERRQVSRIRAFDLETGEPAADGELDSTVAYEGAFRVRTPAGVFDTVLVREYFAMKLGPLSATDDRFLFYARDVGLVAEIEGVKASALLLMRIREDSAKVLEAYPTPAD